MSSPPVKKRKFVVLKRRPQISEPVASDSTPEAINDDIYDLSAHIKEVKHTEVKPDPVPAPPSPKAKVENATPKKPTRATRSNSKPALIELDSEEDDAAVVEDESDDDIDPDVELQQALARARKLREEKETAERLLKAAEEEKEETIEEATPVKKKKKEKTYRGEKVCFSLAFPKIEDKSWNPVLFITRSLIPFYEIQEKLTQLLHQRCAEDDIYPPPEHVLDEFIFTFRGSRIFRNSTCSTMGITTRDPQNCPEVQWLNKEDAEKFRLRSSNGGDSDSEIEEMVEELDDVEEDIEEEPEPEEPEEEDMELSMTGKDKKPVVVRVGLTREFRKLAEHYAKEKGVAVGTVELWFDGEKIDLKKRVEELDVEDEDMLEVRLTQTQ